jgi:hypothetical protein
MSTDAKCNADHQPIGSHTARLCNTRVSRLLRITLTSQEYEAIVHARLSIGYASVPCLLGEHAYADGPEYAALLTRGSQDTATLLHTLGAKAQ